MVLGLIFSCLLDKSQLQTKTLSLYDHDSVLNFSEHKIFPGNKITMPTIVGTLMCIGRKHFMLSYTERKQKSSNCCFFNMLFVSIIIGRINSIWAEILWPMLLMGHDKNLLGLSGFRIKMENLLWQLFKWYWAASVLWTVTWEHNYHFLRIWQLINVFLLQTEDILV